VIRKKKSYADAVNQRPPVSQLESGKKYRSSRGSGTLTIIFSPTSVKIMTRRRLPRGFPPRNLSWIFTRIPLSCIGSPRAPAIIRILTGLVFNGLNKCRVFIGPGGGIFGIRNLFRIIRTFIVLSLKILLFLRALGT
jgi:hypothetical protein